MLFNGAGNLVWSGKTSNVEKLYALRITNARQFRNPEGLVSRKNIYNMPDKMNWAGHYINLFFKQN